MNIKELFEVLEKSKELHTSILIIIFILLILIIYIDSFIFYNNPNIFICILLLVSVICIINKCRDIKHYCNLFDSLKNEELEVLQAFYKSNSAIAEIKNNYVIVKKLSDMGIEIYNVGELYEGNTRTENGKVYSDIMSKVKLKDEYLLEYIKYYFKFIIKK